MDEQKVYRGFRNPDMPRASGETMVFVNDEVLPAAPDRLPGFSWGYPGAGARNLAAAILFDYFHRGIHEDTLQRLSDALVEHFLADLPYDVAWTITSTDIERFLSSANAQPVA